VLPLRVPPRPAPKLQAAAAHRQLLPPLKTRMLMLPLPSRYHPHHQPRLSFPHPTPNRSKPASCLRPPLLLPPRRRQTNLCRNRSNHLTICRCQRGGFCACLKGLLPRLQARRKRARSCISTGMLLLRHCQHRLQGQQKQPEMQ
jgi:hypothetical protein